MDLSASDLQTPFEGVHRPVSRQAAWCGDIHIVTGCPFDRESRKGKNERSGRSTVWTPQARGVRAQAKGHEHGLGSKIEPSNLRRAGPKCAALRDALGGRDVLPDRLGRF
jgi:hypothetical protein